MKLEIYKRLLRPLLFSVDPETVHHLVMGMARPLNNATISSTLEKFCRVHDDRLKIEVAGIPFANPLGLAAGFDKDCRAGGLWRTLGFGHVEFGTVTALPQAGNPRPRIFRLEKDQAIINRMGFPGPGAEALKKRLQVSNMKFSHDDFRVGMNLGKGRDTALSNALDDYIALIKTFENDVDFLTINLSSPNTPGLRELQNGNYLPDLLSGVMSACSRKLPIFIKISPDLGFSELEQLVISAQRSGVSALIATNTTLARRGLRELVEEKGGLSGIPLRNKALETVKNIRLVSSGNMPVIGVGGIFSAHDAVSFLTAGASLVQIYTGLIYEGPALVRTINLELSSWMKRENITSLQQVIGNQEVLASFNATS